ncbi:MAG TPA: translation initiation factor 2 [Pseudomonas sp.]|nr:translation initiation factor 2 [Pseudomonas sp.]
MLRYRFLTVLLVSALLAGCDDKPVPPDPIPSPPSAPAVQTAEPAAEAPPQVAEPAPPVPAVVKPTAAVSKQTPPALPALGSKVVKDTSLPKPEEREPKPAAKVSTSQALPPAKLDLRLPPGMVEQLQPEELAEADLAQAPLLPEMFVKKPAEPGPFELNGRLITNEHSEDYRDSVEGAELQFKFHH